MRPKNVLLLLCEGTELSEAAAFIDVLGWSAACGKVPVTVTTASTNGDQVVCTFGVRVIVDRRCAEVNAVEFDGLAIPGGFESFHFYEDAYSPSVQNLIKQFVVLGKPVAAVCVGALPLAKTGSLRGRRATTYHLMDGRRRKQLADLGAVVVDEMVVEDGQFITSTSPATAMEVALRLLAQVTSVENASAIRNLMGFGCLRTDASRTNPPWLKVPLADYEAHMALPSVAQSQLLATTLQRLVSHYQPRSLAILGAAGGNGLQLVDSAIVRRVVAIDFNPDYLAVCESRHTASFSEFQPVIHDLSQGPPAIEPVECIFAGLVLEYLRLDVFCSYLSSLLTDGGTFATLLQLPSEGIPEVSVSPFSSLTQLQSAFSFVSPTHLNHLLAAQGFLRLSHEQIDLDTGKSFYFASYQLSKRPDEPNRCLANS